jgi:rSAM/selenodomain-associated transferase 2
MTPADISVVIPAINEDAVIANAVRSARAAGARDVIIADGGSEDSTIDVATAAGASEIVRSQPGRGVQLNAGASAAAGEFVLFLHADNELSEDCLTQITEHPAAIWGAFRQHINSPRSVFRLIERGNSMRVKYRGMPFGDQAIFVRRTVFSEQGGFAKIPLMEDIEFSKRLRKVTDPILLDGPLSISARRWEKHGVVRQTFRNWSIQLSYICGQSPEDLKRRYG